MSEHRIFATLRHDDRRRGGGETIRIILVIAIILLLGWNIFFVDWSNSGSNLKKPKRSLSSELADLKKSVGNGDNKPEARTSVIEPIQEPASTAPETKTQLSSIEPAPVDLLPDESKSTQTKEDHIPPPMPADEPAAAASSDSGDQARSIITGLRNQGEVINPDSLFAQAKNFLKDGSKADGYLLYFYLAKKGHGPSALALAEMADPAFYDKKTSFYNAPDFSQARKWYIQAAMMGERKADKQLADLKLRVKAAAASGNESARRLLVGW